MSHPIKELGDAASYGTLAGYIAGLLPSIATLLTVVWLAIRIYESETVQRMLKREKNEPERDQPDQKV